MVDDVFCKLDFNLEKGKQQTRDINKLARATKIIQKNGYETIANVQRQKPMQNHKRTRIETNKLKLNECNSRASTSHSLETLRKH